MPIYYYNPQPNTDLWAAWSATTTTYTTAATTVWNNWLIPTTGATGGTLTYQVHDETSVFTEEQRVAQAQRAVERAERRREAEVAREAANAVASETLRLLLSEEQWASWEANAWFDEVLPSGAVYRLHRGVSGNVRHTPAGRRRESLCAHPSTHVQDDDGEFLGLLPTVDVVIAQVLALRTDEEGFRRVANISPWYGQEDIAA